LFAAFDCIDNTVLLERLKTDFGITGKVLQVLPYHLVVGSLSLEWV